MQNQQTKESTKTYSIFNRGERRHACGQDYRCTACHEMTNSCESCCPSQPLCEGDICGQD